jgi:hypothetical protein
MSSKAEVHTKADALGEAQLVFHALPNDDPQDP